MSEVRGDKLGLRVDITFDPDTDVVRVAGEIDIATASHFDEVLSSLSGRRLVIDMREVEFIDSTGLHCLVNARTRSGDGSGICLLVRRPSSVVRVLDLAGLTQWFVVEEVDDSTREPRAGSSGRASKGDG